MIGTALRAGLADVRTVWGRAFMLLVQSVLVLVLLTVAGGEVLRSQHDIAAANTIAASGGSYFVPAGESSNSLAMTEDAIEALAVTLDDQRRAYAIVKTGDPDTGQRVLIVYGGLIHTLRPDAPPPVEPVALAGPRARLGVGDTVGVLEKKLQVTGTLPAGLGVLDPWMGFEPLDGAVVILSPLRALHPGPGDGAWSEVIARVVLPSGGDPIAHVAFARSVGVNLIPRSFADKQVGAYAHELLGKMLFVAAFAAAVGSALVGILGVLLTVLRSRRRDHAIHRIVGAGLPETIARLAVFVGVVWLVPLSVAVTLGSVVLRELPGSEALLMALVLAGLVLAGALVAWAAYVTQTQDPMDALREETT